MDKKITMREGFERARAVFADMGDDAMVEFFDARLTQVAKKNSGNRKPTAKQVENEGIKAQIADWMEPGVVYASANVAKGCPACDGLSPQRVSALLSQMGNAGAVTVTEEKRKHFYTLAE